MDRMTDSDDSNQPFCQDTPVLTSGFITMAMMAEREIMH